MIDTVDTVVTMKGIADSMDMGIQVTEDQVFLIEVTMMATVDMDQAPGEGLMTGELQFVFIIGNMHCLLLCKNSS